MLTATIRHTPFMTTNEDFIKMIFNRSSTIYWEEEIRANSKKVLVTTHSYDDCDYVCIIADKLGFGFQKWTKNGKAYTTIFIDKF